MVVAAAALLMGCGTFRPKHGMVGPRYRPTNIYQASETLAPELKRVAVLPLASVTPAAEAEFGCKTLAPILLAELAKAQRFEAVPVSPEQLWRLTGRLEWKGDERLPRAFFDRLREALGCEAVLFPRLTHYQPYQPLMVGWHLTLVDSKAVRVLWSVDEVFDASQAAVVRAAWRYAARDPAPSPFSADLTSVLRSPRLFGQYTASAITATLPKR
jgi:hypothetical protein